MTFESLPSDHCKASRFRRANPSRRMLMLCAASSSRWSMRCHLSWLLRTRGQLDAQAVDFRSHQDLAGMPLIGLDEERPVEHVDFLIARRREPPDPVRVDIDVAGGAGAGASALGLD